MVTNWFERPHQEHLPQHRAVWQFLRWSVFGFIGITLGFTFQQWLVGRVIAQDAPVLSPSQEAMRLLRKSCFEKEPLLGVLVQSCELRPGEITLQGLLDHDRQREPLQQETRSVVSASPRLREGESATVGPE